MLVRQDGGDSDGVGVGGYCAYTVLLYGAWLGAVRQDGGDQERRRCGEGGVRMMLHVMML